MTQKNRVNTLNMSNLAILLSCSNPFYKYLNINNI